MEYRNKLNLLRMAYFTLSAVTVVMCVIFMMFLASQTTMILAQIGYFILSGVLVLVIVYDIICTYSSKMKYITGLIIYIVSVVTIVMSIVLFFSMSIDGAIPLARLFEYCSFVFLSYISAAFAIAAYTVGERLNELSVNKVR